MITKVVNIRHEGCDVYIGRAGHGQSGYFGNNVHFGPRVVKSAKIHAFKHHFEHRIEHDVEFRYNVLLLKGKVLGCFCKPDKCHGDVYAEYLNNMSDEQYNSLLTETIAKLNR